VLDRARQLAPARQLGLSRQGFYAKMRRYGLGDLDGSEEPDDADA
jgi:DNA-binding NtrC family response regulator